MGLFINLVWAVGRVVRRPDGDSIVNLVLAVTLMLLAFFVRQFPIRAQDRVIRLEMRLRLKELLPPDLQVRIPEFSTRQLIAMRFASDAELPAIAAAVLRDNLQNPDAIKKRISDWQPDHLRV